MSDIEREEFEQAFLNQYTDFERFENGEYMDDFLQQSWIGWQASRQALSSCSEIPNSSDHITDAGEMVGSRQALEGEPVAVVDRVGIMQRLSPYTNLPEGTKLYTHPASAQAPEEIERDGINSTENLAYIDGYNDCAKEVRENARPNKQAVSVPEWIKCSEQRPNVLDVWIKMKDGSVVACWAQLDGDFYWKGGGSESFILEHTVTHWKPRQEEQGHE